MPTDEELAKRTELKILYYSLDSKEYTDISLEITPFIKSFAFTDNSSDSVDDINLTVHDMNDVWLEQWQPNKGDRIKAWIKDLYCGDFEIDELTFSGYPKQLEIKGVSAPVSKSLRKEKKSRAWQDVKLSEMLKDIAEKCETDYSYEAEEVGYDRKDQRDESDLAFLKRLCDEQSYKLKVTDDKIVVFDEEKFESVDAQITLNQRNILNYRLNNQSHDTYTACRVEYFDEDEKETNNYTYTSNSTEEETGQTLVVKRRVKTLAEAKKLAEKSLREKNKNGMTANITVANNIDNRFLNAGMTFNLSGFGMFDGKYIVDKASHSVSNGYTIGIESHKVVDV